MKRAATLVLVMLAMSASAAVEAQVLAHLGEKTQWAPTRSPSRLNARAAWRLSSVTAPWGVTTVGWEEGGQRLKTLGTEAFAYDGRGWLESVTTGQGVRRYSYDGRGNRLTETFERSSATEVRQFSYDKADRLVAVQEWDGHIEAWALHGDGAKQQEKQWPSGTNFGQPFDLATPNPVVTKNYTYNADGALEAVTNAVSGVVEVGYTHDNNGQVTQRTVGGVSTTYGWDVDGRLVTANSSGPGLPTLAATYDYDGLGMRRRAQVSITPINGPPVSTIRNWTWGGSDGEDEVEEDGNVTTFVAGYRVGDGINAFSHDGIGSVVAQNDGATNEAQFSTWGTRTALGTNFGPLASSAGFTGHRVESALGLSYAKRRWLDSSTGTWLSRDDVGAASYLQSPNELNPWQYAAGNPTRFTDPDGRRPPTLEEEGELNEMAQVVDELRTERAKLSGWRQALAGLGNDGLELVERNLNQRRDAIALAEEEQPVVFSALGQANAEGGNSPFGFVFDGEGFPYLFTQEGVTVNQLPLFPNWHGYDIHDQVASADRGTMENVDRALNVLNALKGGRLAARRPGSRGKNTFAPARTAAITRAVKKFLGIGPKASPTPTKPPTQPSNPFANKPPDSPIYTPYDPRLPGRPDPARTIDSRGFVNPGDFNAEGFPRDNLEFWRLWRVRFPQTISPSNAYRLDKVGVSPVVDDTWLKTFPEHAGNRGQTLVHHHVVEFPRWPTGGPSTMPVPSGGHPGSGGAIHGIP